MLNRRYDSIVNTRDFLILDLLLKTIFALNKYRAVTPKTLAIVKLDGIGDYILFRNFIKIIKESERFKEYKITLCGNIIWKDIAEFFDRKYIDDFIWIDKIKFRNKLSYKLSLVKQMLGKGFEITVHPTHSRDILADIVAGSAGLNLLIGDRGNTKNIGLAPKKITDSYYSKLIETGNGVIFEFIRNKKFIESFLSIGSDIKKPQMDATEIKSGLDFNKPYAVLFPGASHRSKMWSTGNFAAIADYLYSKYRYDVVVCESKNKYSLAEEITKQAKNAKIRIVSESSLVKLAGVISNSKILISNDTGPMHMGAALFTPVICISSGLALGRYTPYPPSINETCITVYPPAIQNISNGIEKDYDKYQNDTRLNINEVEVIEVMKYIDALLLKNYD